MAITIPHSLFVSKGINSPELERQLNNIVEKHVNRYESAGKQAMKEIRVKSDNSWFGHDDNAINDALIVKSNVSQKNGNVHIVISSGIDVSLFEQSKDERNSRSKYGTPYSKLESWREKHSKPFTYLGVEYPAIYMSYSVGEYLLYNYWYYGYRALPPRGEFTPWVNKNFKAKEPLGEYTTRMIQKKWKNNLHKYLK